MVDALASGASARKGVRVQVPSRAPRCSYINLEGKRALGAFESHEESLPFSAGSFASARIGE